MNSPKNTPKNLTIIYLFLKIALLYAYYSLLHYFGLGWEFKFWSYMLVTPIIKYFYLQNETTQSKFLKVFIASVLLDSVFAYFYFYYIIHAVGYWIAIYLLILSFWTTGTEYLQFKLFGEKDESYVIKLSNNSSDFLLFPIILSIFISVGLYFPDAPIFTPNCFLSLMLLSFVADFIFGNMHKLMHTNPYLRKLHMVHHEYRREDLNTFANFYAEFTDSLLMNVPGALNAVMTIMFSLGTLPFKELGVSGQFVHHKYPNHQMNFGYFFEFDLIDMIMDRLRVSSFHNIHHHLVDQNFSIFGFISDDLIWKVQQYFKNGYHSSFDYVLKHYNLFKKSFKLRI